MLCFRRTCPFGLPDDVQATEPIVLLSVGHALRAATAHLGEAPLPASLAALLAQLELRGRDARRRTRKARHGKRIAQDQPAGPSAGASPAAELQAAV